MGGELGWDAGRVDAEAERWVGDAAAEGIDPAARLSATASTERGAPLASAADAN